MRHVSRGLKSRMRQMRQYLAVMRRVSFLGLSLGKIGLSDTLGLANKHSCHHIRSLGKMIEYLVKRHLFLYHAVGLKPQSELGQLTIGAQS